jgi:sporadic carbohydrate cluster protein (TIGR04323 family)
MNKYKIKNNVIGDSVFIIAEIGINHDGSLSKCKKLIKYAKKSGADYIKFQHHIPDEEMLKKVPRSKNFSISLYNFLKKYSFKIEDHKILMNYCKKKKFHYLLSATEYKSENSYLILYELLKNLSLFDGILFYSIFQRPVDKIERIKIYSILLKKKKSLYFALENLRISKQEDINTVEKIILIKKYEIQNKKNNVQFNRKEKNYVQFTHNRTKRNYLERMSNHKIECMKVSKNYDYDYWDGDRMYGYGGYRYIKDYWKKTAVDLIKDYKLNNESKLLDVGCGKGFLLYEIKKILPKIYIIGIDISKYAIQNSHPKIKKFLKYFDINKKLFYKDKEFDLVISLAALHNLDHTGLDTALLEIERVGKKKYIMVESFTNEIELFNLQCWALTCQSFLSKRDWIWFFNKTNYSGFFTEND